MKKKLALWVVEIVLSILSSIIVLQAYRTINILTLYVLLFAPVIITAMLYAILIKSKKLKKIKGRYIYISSGIFAIIGTTVFVVMDIVIRYKKEVFSTIVENTRNVIDVQYLIIKESSSFVDFVMIFAFVFLIFMLIGRKKEGE